MTNVQREESGSQPRSCGFITLNTQERALQSSTLEAEGCKRRQTEACAQEGRRDHTCKGPGAEVSLVGSRGGRQ